MARSNRELWLAFIAIAAITALYLMMMVLLAGVPGASSFYGHSMGVLGFILMLMTETLYTLRKRSRNARWGRMADWLNFHIFTGIVGPYLVLLHSSWKFNGLAGVTMLLTVVIVVSGFIGRYIYTAIPRSADGAELEAEQIERQAAALQAELESWLRAHPELAQALPRPTAGVPATAGASFALDLPVGGARWRGLRWRGLRWRKMRLRLAGQGLSAQVEGLERLAHRQATLRRQMASLAMARRLLALWHAVHIPIGMALFTAAFIHVIAAFYYATLLR